MPGNERLGQPDLRDELGDGRLARGQTSDDAEAVDVGQGLVDETQLAQLVGLEDGVRDRASDVGARGAQGESPAEATRRINDGLYQWGLILARWVERCQGPARRPSPDDDVAVGPTSSG
jgi:hypothetical protein